MKNTFDDYVDHWRQADEFANLVDGWLEQIIEGSTPTDPEAFTESIAHAAAAQIHATLALATAVTRIADKLEEMTTAKAS